MTELCPFNVLGYASIFNVLGYVSISGLASRNQDVSDIKQRLYYVCIVAYIKLCIYRGWQAVTGNARSLI